MLKLSFKAPVHLCYTLLQWPPKGQNHPTHASKLRQGRWSLPLASRLSQGTLTQAFLSSLSCATLPASRGLVETPEFQTPRTLSKRSWTFLFLSATLEKAASPIGRYKKNNKSSVISCTNKPSLTGHWDGCFFLRFRCQPSKEEHCWQDGSPLTLVSLVSLVPQKPMASNPPSITEELAW